MGGLAAALPALDFAVRELALFAAFGFLVIGLCDLLVDCIWLSLRLLGRQRTLRMGDLPAAADDRALAVFVPAWDESAVIEAMLRSTVEAFGDAAYRLYVGCYPNDPATIAAVKGVGERHIRLVVGAVPGPTTKADCLNRLWRAMIADEQAEGRRFKAVVLHDAEDVVHRGELAALSALVEHYDLVQLPVVPLIHPKAPWISGHYADEFAESHGKELVVRQAIGAAIPSAGVGCAFAREALERVALRGGGDPFDADSVTEDYELGLKLRAMGCRQIFARIRAGDGSLVATREYFPLTWRTAMAQKARWTVGIALSGWDRLGWSGGVAERLMRLRDRQSLLAALLLVSGYVSFFALPLLALSGAVMGRQSSALPPELLAALQFNLALLGWRIAMRFGFVTHAYGWRQGLFSIPRILTGNIVAMGAAARAVMRYRLSLETGRPQWDKTDHAFPGQGGAPLAGDGAAPSQA